MRTTIHLKAILALSMTFFIFVGLAACSLLGWTNPAPGSIVGTWQFTSGADSFNMILNSDLTFTQAVDFGGTPHTLSGTYTSDTSSIIFTTTVFDGVPGPAQIDTADYSLSPNGNSLVLAYRSGTPPILVLARP